MRRLTFLAMAGVAIACSRTPKTPLQAQPGHYLYVADAAAGTVAGYRLNEATGALSPAADRVALDRRGGTAVAAMHPSERFIYIADGPQIQLRALNKDGLPAKAVTSYYDVAAGDLALTGQGRQLFAFAASHRAFSLFDVNPASAELVEVPGSPVAVDEGAMAARPHPNGQLFFALSAGSASSQMQVWVRTPDSIMPVVGSPFTLAADAVSFAISPDGRHLLVAHKALAAAVYAIDDAAQMHPVAGSPFTLPDVPLVIEVDPGGALAYLAYARGSLDVFTLGPDGSLSRRASTARSGPVSRLIAIAVPDQPIAVASLPSPDSAELLPIVTAAGAALELNAVARTLAAVIVLVCAAAAPAGAQSLADASRRAKENSAANKVYTPTYNDSTLNSSLRALAIEVVGHDLSMPELRKWMTVTNDMKKAFAADKALAERVKSASEWARSLGQIERSYIREEKIGTLFQKHGITAHEYVMTQVAFVFALAAQMNPQFASIIAILPGSRVNGNADLLRANQTEVDAIIKDVDSTIKLDLE